MGLAFPWDPGAVGMAYIYMCRNNTFPLPEQDPEPNVDVQLHTPRSCRFRGHVHAHLPCSFKLFSPSTESCSNHSTREPPHNDVTALGDRRQLVGSDGIVLIETRSPPTSPFPGRVNRCNYALGRNVLASSVDYSYPPRA